MALPTPQEVRATFLELMKTSSEEAVRYLHDLGVSSRYIDMEALSRNITWTSLTPFGDLECTINLSKPEKDPRAIAAAGGAGTRIAEATADAEATAADKSNAASGSVSAIKTVSATNATSAMRTDAAAGTDVTAGAAASLDVSPCSSSPEISRNKKPLLPGNQAEADSSSVPLSDIPQCDICWENEEFCGTPEHPAKPGLRVVPITLGDELWGLQYSPHAYFSEHCIVLSKEHRPMKIDAHSFTCLLDFVDLFPFYFIGSNADLPIVGGSILSHDHFQGGRHVFPLMKAPIKKEVHLEETTGVQCGIVDWPASVLRLTSDVREPLEKAALNVLNAWQGYSDEARGILASTDARHNTLNAIVRKEEKTYIMDLVLRNNRTDAQHPWGIFHADESMHHIKKENIGLIEIMGRAILPPRLAEELPYVQHLLIEAAQQNLAPEELTALLKQNVKTVSHANWAVDIYLRRAAEFVGTGNRRSESGTFFESGLSGQTKVQQTTQAHEAVQASTLHPVIQQEVTNVFVSILETTGVFKHDEAGAAGWDSFIKLI